MGIENKTRLLMSLSLLMSHTFPFQSPQLSILVAVVVLVVALVVALLAAVFVVSLGETEATWGVGVAAISTPQKRMIHSHNAVNPVCSMSKCNYKHRLQYRLDSGVSSE